MNTAASFSPSNLPKLAKLHESNSNLSFRYRGFANSKYSSLDNKISHYHSDGRGRDLYIKSEIYQNKFFNFYLLFYLC